MADFGLTGLLNKLTNGRNASFVALGDSTTEGMWDSVRAANSPDNAGLGWVGRLGPLIGAKLNVNARLIVETQTGAISVHTPLGWSSAVSLWSSTLGDSAPTLTIYNGGLGGTRLSDTEAYLSNLLQYAPNSDGIIIGTGFNDLMAGTSAAAWVAAYRTLISNIQSACPGVPIIATTQNQTSDVLASLVYAGMRALVLALTGQSWPLTPPSVASTAYDNVSVLDTWQAFDGHVLNDLLTLPGTSGFDVHPNAAGNDVIAGWIMDQSSFGGTLGGAIIKTTMGTPTGIGPGKGGLTLPANWKAGDVFAAQDENNVTGTLNLLIAAIARLGPSLNTVPSGWHTDSVWNASDEDAVATAINSLNAAVSQLGGPTLPNVPATGAAWTAVSENIIESAINALDAAVTVLSGGG